MNFAISVQKRSKRSWWMGGNKLNTAALTAPDTSLSSLAPKTGDEREPVTKPDAANHFN